MNFLPLSHMCRLWEFCSKIRSFQHFPRIMGIIFLFIKQTDKDEVAPFHALFTTVCKNTCKSGFQSLLLSGLSTPEPRYKYLRTFFLWIWQFVRLFYMIFVAWYGISDQQRHPNWLFSIAWIPCKRAGRLSETTIFRL